MARQPRTTRPAASTHNCDVCGRHVPAGDVHAPHDVDCQLSGDGYCDCGAQTCPRCCWHPDCQEHP